MRDDSDQPGRDGQSNFATNWIQVTLNREGNTSRFSGPYSEGAPDGNPFQITRSFQGNLNTNSDVNSMDNGTVTATRDDTGAALVVTDLSSNYVLDLKYCRLEVQILRPGMMWPPTINYEISVTAELAGSFDQDPDPQATTIA